MDANLLLTVRKKELRGAFRFIIVAAYLFFIGCFAGNFGAARRLTQSEVDKLLIADCRIPGELITTASGVTIPTTPQVDKIPLRDCERRGGQAARDLNQALEIWRPLAKSGNPRAQYYVGLIHEEKGEYKIAADWYLQASQNKYWPAAMNLFHFYDQGLGVQQNRKLAEVWWERAAGSKNVVISGPSPDLPYVDPKTRIGIDLPSQVSRLGAYHALVIGNDNYQNLDGLDAAVNDANEVGRVLRQLYSFRVVVLRNATRQDILAELGKLKDALAEEDNLLIYYAGHGGLKNRDEGHWGPVDASHKVDNTWISNRDISKFLERMKVRQLLVVSDSCYSGAMAESTGARPALTQSNEETLNVLLEMGRKQSRMVMTSGGLLPVGDRGSGKHSIFAQSFLDTLQANVGLLSGRELFRRLRSQVVAETTRRNRKQVPLYAPLKWVNHVPGDFIFMRTAA